MSSFARTIQSTENPDYVEEILLRDEGAIPLPLIPSIANVGDYIYLVYDGKIIGRAKISEIDPHPGSMRIGSTQNLYHYRSRIIYRAGWERPNIDIYIRGFQGIRYLNRLGFGELDQESWLAPYSLEATGDAARFAN